MANCLAKRSDLGFAKTSPTYQWVERQGRQNMARQAEEIQMAKRKDNTYISYTCTCMYIHICIINMHVHEQTKKHIKTKIPSKPRLK